VPGSPKPTPTAGPAPFPAAATPDSARQLRDLAAGHLTSDGAGGWRVNEQAATELEKLPASTALQLWPLLDDPQADVRRGAAFFLLGKFHPGEAQHVAAFVKLLADDDPSVRGFALEAARQMQPADQAAAAPHLAAMLDPAREDKADNRPAIIRMLARLATDASAATDKIAAAAKDDPDPSVRKAALAAIVQVALPPQSVAALATGLSDDDAGVRLVAAARLRQLGIIAAPASKKLAAALADSDDRVANAAAEALVNIGATAVEPLIGQLTAENIVARKLALACLAKIGRDAAPAVPAIGKLQQDPDPQVRELAAAALARVKSP
jgi:HEAT repeat protein